MNWIKHISVLIVLAAAMVSFPSPSLATVSNTTVSTTTVHGTGAQTSYTIGFDFRDNSWIGVALHDTSTVPETVTTIAQGAGASKFTISGGNPGTTVVMGTAPTTTQYLVITRSVPLTQPVVFDPASIFPYSGISAQLDQITLELQNLASGVSGGGSSSGTVIPSGAAYNLLGWNSDGSTLVNYGGGSLVNGDILQFNGSSWVPYLLNGAALISTINGGTTQMVGSVGGTGVNNSGTLTWGSHALSFTLTGDTSLTLPTSGTLVAGVTSTSNVSGDIVIRDGSGNFSAGTITASIAGNVTGNLTGNLTGNASGTASNVTGTVAIGHGGTGATTQASAITALTGTQTNHYVLRSDGTNSALGALVTADLPSGIPYTKMASQTADSILITDDLGSETVLPTNVNSGYVLTSNGVSPAWAPQGSGIPGIFPYGADTGAANAYVVASPNPPIVSYALGIGVSFTVGNSNTGASTINVSSLGAKNIVHADGTALVLGDLVAGKMAIVEYDGTDFQLINPRSLDGGQVLTTTATATATAAQSYIVANCAANCTITLPAISSLASTYPFQVKNIATTVVTVQGTSDNLDGASTAVLNFQWQSITLTPTSNGWLIQ